MSQGAAVAIIAILDLQLKADSLETAHKVLHATLTDTRAFPGCLGVAVLVDSDDPAHVVLYGTWESIEQDRAYRAWRASPDGTSELGSILVAAPKLTVFTAAEGALGPLGEGYSSRSRSRTQKPWCSHSSFSTTCTHSSTDLPLAYGGQPGPRRHWRGRQQLIGRNGRQPTL
jgi:heme oxygenase (mycobilin-producing)